MASVTASRFVSTSSTVHSAGPLLDSKTNLLQVGLRNQIETHNGLRAVNKVGMLQYGSNVKQSRGTHPHMATHRTSATTIVCGTGSCLVFVTCEVGPWSKTGGLGDVLGGLPPAMAVSDCSYFPFFSSVFIICDTRELHIILVFL